MIDRKNKLLMLSQFLEVVINQLQFIDETHINHLDITIKF